MADELHVDLAALQIGSDHIGGAAGDAAVDFILHEDGIVDAAPGWIGESARALDNCWSAGKPSMPAISATWRR